MKLLYIWNHRKEIIEGWWNYLTNNKKAKSVEQKRLDVCNICPFRKSFNHITGEWEKKVEDDECGLCGCPLKVKTLAMPEAKWGEGGCPKKSW